MVDPNISRLELFLRTMRHAGSALLQEDMWQQWGSRGASDEEYAQHAEIVSDLTRTREVALADLTALAAELRQTAPGTVEAWAEAHIDFLAAFIAEVEGDEKNSTSVYVAREEQKAWELVKSGEQSYVDENTFYVSIDPDRYRATFDVEP